MIIDKSLNEMRVGDCSKIEQCNIFTETKKQLAEVRKQNAVLISFKNMLDVGMDKENASKIIEAVSGGMDVVPLDLNACKVICSLLENEGLEEVIYFTKEFIGTLKTEEG